jgi:hypothetical protein
MNRLLKFSLLGLSLVVLLIACQKEYSLELGKPNVSQAQGTLYDTLTGECMPSFVEGTYYNGIATADTNIVRVVVNFTTAGSYSISTGTVNGFSFGDTGFIGAPGLDTIYLRATGTPINIQPTDFTITLDSSTCGFTIDVQDSTGVNSGGGGGNIDINQSDTAWQFSEGLNNFNGKFFQAYIADTVVSGQNLKILVLLGGTAVTGDSTFALGAILPTGVITPGDYLTNNGAFFEFFDAFNNSIYAADPVLTGTPVVTTITITSYDPVTKIVRGTFGGTAQNYAGAETTITNGSFTAEVAQ